METIRRLFCKIFDLSHDLLKPYDRGHKAVLVPTHWKLDNFRSHPRFPISFTLLQITQYSPCAPP